MSIEQAIIDNTAALNRVAALLQAGAVAIPQAAAPVAAPVAAPAVTSMPAPPTFTMPPAAAPVAPPAPAGAPFTDPQGLMNYTMAAYQEMGATKGAAIQQVLASLGHANMNDVKPEQYAQFYAGVEALKRG